MNDNHKTKTELIKELKALRQQLAHWEEAKSGSRYIEEAPKENQNRGIFIDVAESSPAVENLRKWAYIFEYADWGVGIVSAQEKTLVLMNPAFARMHGYTEEELIGRPITEVFVPEHRDEMPQKIWIADDKDHHILESKHIRKDGTVFPVQIDVTVVKDQEGRVQFRAVHVQDITERKRAEEALQESEESFRRVFEEGSLGMCIAGPDFRFTKVNEAFCRMIGYAAQELALLSFKDITHPEHLAQDVASVNKLITGEIPVYRTEKRYRKKDGKTIWAASTITVMKDQSGQVLYFLSFIDDITERKHAEERLRESETRYRLLVDSSIDGVLLTDPNGAILNVNPAACQIFGYTEDEILNLGRGGIVDTSDPRYPSALEERAKTGRFRGELMFIRKDGTKFPADISTSVFRDKEGQLRTSTIIRDITKQKQAVEALRLSEERYRTIIETIEDGYYEVDLAGNLTYFNDTIVRIHEYPRAELLGMNNRQYTDAKNSKILFKDFNRVYRTGEPSKGTHYEIITKGGGRKNLESSVSLIRDSNGNPVGFRGIVRDVTELMQAQKALQASEERFRIAAESTNDFIYEWDIQSGQIDWSSTSGLKLTHILGELPVNAVDFDKRIYPEDRERFSAAVINHLRQGSPYLEEYRMIGKDGNIIHLSAAGTCLRNEDGRAYKWIGVLSNITERKKSEDEIKLNLEKLHKTMGGIIQAMAFMVETKDPYTAGHQQKVSHLARTIAQEMGLSKDQVEAIRLTGVVHDLGKISIPSEILSKPTKLSDLEFGLIKGHSQITYNILKSIDFPWPIAQIALQHHERMNGSGYPAGLKGDEILIEAQVLMVADVVEAIASHRPYRASKGIEEALEEISKNKGTLYNPTAVVACLRLFKDKGYEFLKQGVLSME
jgi:PAS domain S-box-containing protein